MLKLYTIYEVPKEQRVFHILGERQHSSESHSDNIGDGSGHLARDKGREAMKQQQRRL